MSRLRAAASRPSRRPYDNEWKRHDPSGGCGTTRPRRTITCEQPSPSCCFGRKDLRASGWFSRAFRNHGHASSACGPSHFAQHSAFGCCVVSGGGSTNRARTPGGRLDRSKFGRRPDGRRLVAATTASSARPPPLSCRRRGSLFGTSSGGTRVSGRRRRSHTSSFPGHDDADPHDRGDVAGVPGSSRRSESRWPRLRTLAT
mmetsp:Transcript_20021/g.62944  ORF Transcript_20021/g.62944 Transcript_20021/m.62944 type:complete len:201 (-) Transcript_20021:38-640(-)